MRFVLALLLSLLAGVLVSTGIAAGDARATLLETDRWVEVSKPVLAEQPVREELATMLVEGVAARLACRGTIGSILAATAVTDRTKAILVGRIEDALGADGVQRAWVDTNRAAHERFVLAARLDEPPSDDRLLDVSRLLDAIGGAIDGKDPDAREGLDEACAATEDPGLQLVDEDVLRGAADGARVLHRVRPMPEVLIIVAVAAFLLSLAFMRPVTSIAGLGVGGAAAGLGWWLSSEEIVDAVSTQVADGKGGVLAQAIAEAALTPAFDHQLVVGMCGVGVIVLAFGAAIVRRTRRGG